MVVGPRQDPQVAPSRRIVFVVLGDSPGPLVASRVSGPGGLSGQRHTDTRGEGPHSLGRGWPGLAAAGGALDFSSLWTSANSASRQRAHGTPGPRRFPALNGFVKLSHFTLSA